MKATRYVQIEEVEYWDCGKPDHRHRGKKSAEACIEENQMTEDQYLEFLRKHDRIEELLWEDYDLYNAARNELVESLNTGDGRRLSYRIYRVLERAREIRNRKERETK